MNKDARTRLRAFVDESKAKDYLLVSVALEVSAVQDARDAVRSLILPGQSRLHMRKESDRRRRSILHALAVPTISTTVIRAPKDGRTDRERRSACIDALVRAAVSDGIDRICFEIDETQQRQDRQRIVETLHRLRPLTVEHRHERASNEPLLALPDAVGWAWAKGGDRRRRCGPVRVTEV